MRCRLVFLIVISFFSCSSASKPLLIADPFWLSFFSENAKGADIQKKYLVINSFEMENEELLFQSYPFDYILTTPYVDLGEDYQEILKVEVNSLKSRQSSSNIPVIYNRVSAYQSLATYVNESELGEDKNIYLIASTETDEDKIQFDGFMSSINDLRKDRIKVLKLNRLENDMRVTLFLDNIDTDTIEYFIFMASGLNVFCIEKTKKFNRPYLLSNSFFIPENDELILGVVWDNPDSVLDLLLNEDFSTGNREALYEIESQFILIKKPFVFPDEISTISAG